MSSLEFAYTFKDIQNKRIKGLSFIIGWADCLSIQILNKVRKIISFGRCTCLIY